MGPTAAPNPLVQFILEKDHFLTWCFCFRDFILRMQLFGVHVILVDTLLEFHSLWAAIFGFIFKK